jgi:DHA2 family multidrug resistance protein
MNGTPSGVISHRWIITLTVMTGTIMSSLNASMVNVALPYMQGNFGASVTEIAWVSTAYILANVITMPIIAMISARFGRKNFYMFSVVLFVVSSMLCGIARDLPAMIVFRILQGIGGGTLIPVSQAVLRETFPPEEQGMAMGIYGMGVILGPACGPVVGGWLTDNLTWRWSFYINVPVGIINLLLVMRFLHDPPFLTRDKGRIDWFGLLFLVVGLGSLQVMLEKGEEKDWFASRFIVTLAVTSAVGLILLVWRELTTDRPAVDLRLLRNVPFASGTTIGGILGMGLNSSLFLMPLFLQKLLGYPALQAGLAMIPRTISMAIVFPLAGRLYNRLGPHWLISSGLLISVLSFWQMSRLSLDVSYANIFMPQFLQGLGFGLIFVALSTAALSSIPRPKLTAATGLYNVIRQVCGSVGIALFATELDSGLNRYRSVLVGHISPLNQIYQNQFVTLQTAMMWKGYDLVTSEKMALRLLEVQLMKQVNMISYNHVFALIALCFVLTLPLVTLLRGAHRTANPSRAK